MSGIKLTIVIPCFDRHELLAGCLKSIGAYRREDIQIVLVDDGSSPPLSDVVGTLLQSQDKLLVQENRGRAAALREGIVHAEGEYVLSMDSDDEFVTGGLDEILNDLHSERAIRPSVVGFVYECAHFNGAGSIAKLPKETQSSILALRADLGITGDLKEVVRTQCVKKNLYPDPGAERRVPTSYIWAGVAADGEVITRAFPVVFHRYIEGGMTSSISVLKKANPYWLARTYLRVACAPRHSYKSGKYRFIYAVKALSVKNSLFDALDLRNLRASVGATQFGLARLIGRALQFAGGK